VFFLNLAAKQPTASLSTRGWTSPSQGDCCGGGVSDLLRQALLVAVRVEELKLSPKDEDVHKMDIPAHDRAGVKCPLGNL